MYKKVNLDKIIVYDIETMKDCFIANFIEYKTKQKKSFVFYNDKEYETQPFEFWKFLRNSVKSGYSFAGFNVLGFDSQVLDEYYNGCVSLMDTKTYELDISEIISQLYNKAQHIIHVQTNMDFSPHLVGEYNLFIPHIDIYKLMHYDSNNKRTSLKWLEFTMRRSKIQESPFNHDDKITKDDLESLIEYCWEDVDATTDFIERNFHEIELRYNLSKQYDLNLINASEPNMAREIFGKYLSKEMKIPMKELRNMKTIRNKISLKDIIFPYISFVTPDFNNILKIVSSTDIDASPNQVPVFKHNFNFKELEVDLGLGGIHGCIKKGIYEIVDPKIIDAKIDGCYNSEEYVMIDQDCTSMYPQICIQNGLKPEHLPYSFNTIYEGLYKERRKYEKKDPRNYILKICLNSLYGLSGEQNSFVYDRKLTYSITLNGQLSLLMYAEALSVSIPSIRFLQMNTDGLTFVIKKSDIPIMRKIQQWWEKTTRLSLEEVEYKKMVIFDVNNYMAIDIKDNVKSKGLFEINMAYHKNPSALVIAKALAEYYTKNTKPEDYIKNNNNIYDFCLAVKKKSNFTINLIQLYNFSELIIEQQKVCRYFVSNNHEKSGILVKQFNDGRRISVHVKTMVEPIDVINYDDAKRYDINYDYYIRETKKIIKIGRAHV